MGVAVTDVFAPQFTVPDADTDPIVTLAEDVVIVANFF